MIYRLLANVVVIFHLGFVGFVILGGFLLRRWPRLVYVHVPVAIWGALIEFAGWVCPLTPLENHFRRLGGQAGYSGGFVEHYLIPILYPHALTRNIQYVLGAVVVAINVAAYVLFARRRQKTGDLHSAG
ncbi:MAG TPA: DUF2784 domain-containing protein [Gemmatimonadaceae bacterium]|nr:DUF2784 domain-containing protein [Gemmatimonadaceae bacterium]